MPKINLVPGLSFLDGSNFAKKLITKGTPPNKFIPLIPFKLDETCLDKPSRFEFEFKQGDKNYAYGFSLNHQWILEEWLYEINQIDEKPLFERKTQTDEEVIVTPGASLQLSDNALDIFRYTGNMGTRPNQLFLTEIAQLNKKKLNILALIDAYQWFDKVLTIMLERISHVRDARLFIIATEGEETEKQYFEDLISKDWYPNPRVIIEVLGRSSNVVM